MSKFAYLSLPLSILAGCNSLIPGGNLDIGDDASNVDPNLPVPTLTVTEPERGLRTNDVDGLLIGTVGGDLVANPPMVFVNQQTVAYDSDGNFEAAVEYPTGTNIIQTIAVDSLGAMNVDHRAVQSGPFTDCRAHTCSDSWQLQASQV